jgi:hypothetical protein
MVDTELCFGPEDNDHDGAALCPIKHQLPQRAVDNLALHNLCVKGVMILCDYMVSRHVHSDFTYIARNTACLACIAGECIRMHASLPCKTAY